MKRGLLVLGVLVFLNIAGVSYAWVADDVGQDTISWLYKNDLTKYNSYGSFRGNDVFTREQAAKFFSQFAIKVKNQKADGTKSCLFLDIDTADVTLKQDIITSCQLGIFQGVKNMFYPKRELTFPEAVAVLMRIEGGKLDESEQPWYKNYWDKASHINGVLNYSIIPFGFYQDDRATRGLVAGMIYTSYQLQDLKTSPKIYTGEIPISENRWLPAGALEGAGLVRDITKNGYRFVSIDSNYDKNDAVDNDLANRSICNGYMMSSCDQFILDSNGRVVFGSPTSSLLNDRSDKNMSVGSLRIITTNGATYSYGGGEGSVGSMGSEITSYYFDLHDKRGIYANYSISKQCADLKDVNGDPTCISWGEEQKTIEYYYMRGPNKIGAGVVLDGSKMSISSRQSKSGLSTMYVSGVPSLEDVYYMAKELNK